MALEHIKDILCRIELLESEGLDSFEHGNELGKLYTKLKSLGYVWNTRIKEWVYDPDSDTEEKDPV